MSTTDFYCRLPEMCRWPPTCSPSEELDSGVSSGVQLKMSPDADHLTESTSRGRDVEKLALVDQVCGGQEAEGLRCWLLRATKAVEEKGRDRKVPDVKTNVFCYTINILILMTLNI